MLERRTFLRGLVAAPAIVAVGSLMPIRGTRLIPGPPLTIPDLMVKHFLAYPRTWGTDLNVWLGDNGYAEYVTPIGAPNPEWLIDIWEGEAPYV